mmetsp:Transcript_27398/g.60852  ORF Transcript_27398/g.60852 Transcript_27398/m.60852 type:complete len:822 (+) Transcript_27398:187-2652(+)|eukprot:CAMPEP_0178516674 /NCGR_PEP_ID=MMETSP0696-20121128/25253_1 /TAXON_ID=265572 /ORGANISM="Extubocellulus spinifer, Strain CCMP396" /LENGTH=821 /DNA_ID=CAMNT_0020146993 /DNA_START=118 /DNA_END=2583 /DNA_ORIENTATION=+
MSSDEEEQQPVSPGHGREEEEEEDEIEPDDVDDDTLRVMVSTDNHLGYAEKDPVRGLDSFAAFEEVLYLAKRFKCDMVLLAGDLFHDNKPSRRTLHKTMAIVRRYCMGPDPVQIQVVSDQKADFRNVNDAVNYEDEFYSIDLPIFSIHGNHDDPTRDGGTEMLAALDLLSVSNLVNYFGRQDEVDKVEISPVLIKKGDTRVAIYGMGSMRDERLNRMWQGKKVRFLEPEIDEGEDEGEDNSNTWFNIFALHQNRDLGRGSKNCVHESMIPDWMDLVVWGHEHECNIMPMESTVGTFRITQPGSSVATSLTTGEAERKQVGILDIRGQDFRLRPIPLSQVRSFVASEVSLSDYKEEELDPEDPNVDETMAEILGDRVKALIDEAREQARALREDAAEEAKRAIMGDRVPVQNYALFKPEQVLVRLKVEHSGFSTLNNQRFGSRFVGEVGNPADILLFHRRRQTETVKTDGKKAKRAKKSSLDEPMDPEELADINVEDLIADNLETSDKLKILEEQSLGAALEDFVSKEQRSALGETVDEILEKKTHQLIKRGRSKNGDDTSISIKTTAALKEILEKEADSARAKAAVEKEEAEEGKSASKKKRGASKQTKKGSDSEEDDENEIENGDLGLSDDDSGEKPRGKATRMKASRSASNGSKASSARSRKKTDPSNDEDDLSDDHMDVEPTTTAKKSRVARPARRTAATKAKYTFDDASDESDFNPGSDDDSDDDVELVEEPPKKGRAKKTASKRSTGTASSSGRGASSSFTSARKTKSKSTASSRSKKRATSYDDDDSEDDVIAIDDGADWGTAGTQSQSKKRSRR